MNAAEELAYMEELAALEEAAKRGNAPSVSKIVETGKNIAGFGLQSAKHAGVGYLKGLAAAASTHPVLGPVMAITGGSPQALERAFPAPVNETPQEKLYRRSMEGLGEGLTVPGMGVIAPALSGATGAIGSELAQNFATSAVPGNDLVKKTAGFLGGLVGGAPVAFALGPKQSVAQADIRRELSGTPDAEWKQASQNIALFNDAGAKTATLAEAFPGKTRIAALANKAINTHGGEQLAQQLAGREADLLRLGNTFLNRIGPEVDAAQVANQLSDAANDYGKTLTNLGSTAVGNRLEGKTVRGSDVAQIYRDLLQKAVQAGKDNPDLAPVYREVAEQLLARDDKGRPVAFVTNLQGLSYQLKNLKESPLGMNASAGRKGENAMYQKAISDAEKGLASVSPDWKQAMDDFAAYQQGPVSAFRTSNIRRAGDTNPNIETPTPLARLGATMTGAKPATVQGNARLLADPMMTGGETVQPLQVARAFAQEKLEGGSTNPGETLRGLPGSLKERRFAALLRAGGASPTQVMAPLRAADQLQGLSGASGASGFPEMRSAQLAIRPFRTIDMMMTGRTEKLTQQEISQLLANPTQEGLAELRKIAMFDPNVRRQLTLLAALRPGLLSAQEK